MNYRRQNCVKYMNMMRTRHLGTWSLYFSHSLCWSLQLEHVIRLSLAWLWRSCHRTLCNTIPVHNSTRLARLCITWCCGFFSLSQTAKCPVFVCLDSVALAKASGVSGVRNIKKCEPPAITPPVLQFFTRLPVLAEEQHPPGIPHCWDGVCWGTSRVFGLHHPHSDFKKF